MFCEYNLSCICSFQTAGGAKHQPNMIIFFIIFSQGPVNSLPLTSSHSLLTLTLHLCVGVCVLVLSVFSKTALMAFNMSSPHTLCFFGTSALLNAKQLEARDIKTRAGDRRRRRAGAPVTSLLVRLLGILHILIILIHPRPSGAVSYFNYKQTVKNQYVFFFLSSPFIFLTVGFFV